MTRREKKIGEAQNNPLDRHYLEKIYASLFGVGIGFYIALVVSILHPFLGVGSQDQILAWTRHAITPEPTEKTLYFLSILLGGLGAAATCKLQSRSKLGLKILILCLTSVSANYIAMFSLRNDSIILPIVGLVFTATLYAYEVKKSSKNSKPEESVPAGFSKETKKYFDPVGLVIGAVLLFFLFFPYSFEHVAAEIGPEVHVASYIFGPALYAKAKLVPGIDFYNQYSLGYGKIWQHFLGKSFCEALLNYTKGITVYSYIFALQLFFFLTWLYKSWKWGLYASLLISIMLFHTERNFFDPSSFCLRYPLYVLVILIYLYYSTKKTPLKSLALAAIIVLGLFLSPETGIYQLMGVLFLEISEKTSIKNKVGGVLKLIIMTIALFLGLVALFYKNEIFSRVFWVGMIEPLILFGSINFGAYPLRWNNVWLGSYGEYHLLYNILLPALCIGICGQALRSKEKCSHRDIAVTYFAATGLLFLAKYLNMSIIGLWLVNSVGLLAVGIYVFKKTLFQSNNNKIGYGVLVAGFLALTLFCNDSRNISLYGLNSWASYPSIPNYLLGRIKTKKELSIKTMLNVQDLEMVKSRATTSDHMAILSLYDFIYLIETQSKPVFPFIPSACMFTKNQIEISKNKLRNEKFALFPIGKSVQEIASYNDLMAALKAASITFIEIQQAQSLGLFEIKQKY